ncbi:hypothetical protein PFICI_08920 [Pestalotiopsis fici W106-1]|uniref:Chromosome transmission fidelity protein 4 n=1 Tax=Pestalotiopsis fici (strain W106-1 / CGMCC3.15140) TaxID=1229662 RepID=W3X0Z4_PESFW|nr:uncharacterized protein PFICI_08920 [Pestalotiopsis fici W106-1]ETS79067.1 hypothetical protein PFICI_08920 [Pestalotiopsis fici W106-1]
MSLSSSLVRSPSYILSSGSRSSRAAAWRTTALPYFASAGPVITSIPSTTTSKSLTTLPTTSSSAQPPVPLTQKDLAPIWFDSTNPLRDRPQGLDPKNPENERKVKLGKTLRILQKRLPTVLQTPLPQEILSPNISLHLFPSTHPYLPTVSGRVAYTAAVWTSPIAWNRVPIIGNLKIEILSERMTTQPLHFSPQRTGAYPEQLVVKWRTASSSSSSTDQKDNPSLTEQGEQKLDETLSGARRRGSKREFTGLFIFEFDREGKIISHTIEHVDQSGEWDKGVGAKVVHLTDWLLGELRGRQPQGTCPMFQITEDHDRKRRR